MMAREVTYSILRGSLHPSAWKESSQKLVSPAENPLVSWQSSVELGERCGAHAVDQHGGADHQAADHPRFLNARLPKREGRVVERRRPYGAEPPEEERVLHPPS